MPLPRRRDLRLPPPSVCDSTALPPLLAVPRPCEFRRPCCVTARFLRVPQCSWWLALASAHTLPPPRRCTLSSRDRPCTIQFLCSLARPFCGAAPRLLLAVVLPSGAVSDSHSVTCIRNLASHTRVEDQSSKFKVRPPAALPRLTLLLPLLRLSSCISSSCRRFCVRSQLAAVPSCLRSVSCHGRCCDRGFRFCSASRSGPAAMPQGAYSTTGGRSSRTICCSAVKSFLDLPLCPSGTARRPSFARLRFNRAWLAESLALRAIVASASCLSLRARRHGPANRWSTLSYTARGSKRNDLAAATPSIAFSRGRSPRLWNWKLCSVQCNRRNWANSRAAAVGDPSLRSTAHSRGGCSSRRMARASDSSAPAYQRRSVSPPAPSARRAEALCVPKAIPQHSAVLLLAHAAHVGVLLHLPPVMLM